MILDCLSDNSIVISLIIHPYLFVVDPNSAPLFAGSKLDDNVKRYVPKNVHVFNYKTWLGDVSLFTYIKETTFLVDLIRFQGMLPRRENDKNAIKSIPIDLK